MRLRRSSPGDFRHRPFAPRRDGRRAPAVRWALATAAPWALATGLLVSFTASAGQPNDVAISLQARMESDLTSELPLGPSLLTVASAFNLPSLSLSDALVRGHVETARLSVEEPSRLVPMNERRPRDDLKPNIAHFPELDRSRKSDPLVSLRPTISLRQQPMEPQDLDRYLFDNNHGGLSARFVPDSGAFPSEPQGLDQPEALIDATDAPPATDASPATASDQTPDALFAAPRHARLAERRLESIDGSTPMTPRAIARASSTPQAEALTPVEIAAAPVSPDARLAEPAPATRLARAPRAVTIARKDAPAERPDYAALIPAERLERESKCLAEAVYFEARSEPEEGQAAVAQVVLNRVRSGIYPDNVCGVVYQNRHRYLSCQFTFACEGRSLAIREPEAWTVAARIARDVLEGRTYLADVGSSTHYHATYVRPWWARRLTKMDAIGRHVFYRLKPGQT